MSGHAEIPWGERLSLRLGHHAVAVLIVAITATVVVGLHPLSGVLMFSVPIALFGVVIVTFLAMRAHDRRLCEQCVVSMPLNPSQQAARYQRRFWMAHTGSEPRFLVPYMVVLVGSNFATSTPGRIAWAVITMSLTYLLLSQATHRRLQPWCPWCRDGGSGDEVAETPPPLPDNDRQLI